MGNQLNVGLLLMKILMVLVIFLSLSGLTFAAELKKNSRERGTVMVTPDSPKTGYRGTNVPGWVRRAEQTKGPNIRKKWTMAANPELSKRAKAAGYKWTDVPGWVQPRYYKTDVAYDEIPYVIEIKKELVDHARTYLGWPYKYGGNNLSGIDCSGFVKIVYGKFGVKLPRTARLQYMMGTSIGRGELSAGDLIFFRRGPSGDPSHVGIFLENDKFIHSSARRNGGVRVDSLDDSLYRRTFVGGRKLVD